MFAHQDELIPDPTRHGEDRLRRNLFLPKYLQHDSRDHRLEGDAQKQAHEILIKWADLESSGRLGRRKESALQGEFLADVFGRALGYMFFAEGQKQWNIEAQYDINGGMADAVIGVFEEDVKRSPAVVIELKSPAVNLDRDRFNGRTAVQQLWDYMNALPECLWGIVSNYVSFRLYHRQHTPRAYQSFVLQDLRRPDVFRQFYYLFERGGLLPSAEGQPARAVSLLERTCRRQEEVGDELYEQYNHHRRKLIQHLMARPHRKSLEEAIRIAQKILDRIVFIAFCEDRRLLPEDTLEHACKQVPPSFSSVVNPRWRNFVDLFRSMDSGNAASGISPYDGGLFRCDDEVDNLQLDDDWTGFFAGIGRYDFRDEVNVDVLGHLFERSVHDLERIRLAGLFETVVDAQDRPKMARSAERKRHGIYYTPPAFTAFLVRHTVGHLIEQRMQAVAQTHGITPEGLRALQPDPNLAAYWRDCFEAVRGIKVIDPACGSGAFLVRAYDVFEQHYTDIVDHLAFHEGKKADPLREGIPDVILRDNLFGVDLSAEAVEITQLALWIRSAQPGRSLADLSRNIVCGNSLVGDPKVDPRALDWQKTFSEVFGRASGGFDCVIGNPPWERMKLQEREFFDAIAPEIAAAVDAATRRRLIAQLERDNPELHARYEAARNRAERALEHVRAAGRFPLTGKGDVNTYAAFAELARSIVARDGRVGLLVPSGIATDHTTKDFFEALIENKSLIGLYDFENRRGLFPDVHRSYKFSMLLFGGAEVKTDKADFVFFAHEMDDLEDNDRHIELTPKDIKLLNPNTRTCPVFRSKRDAEITKAIYRRVPILVDHGRKKGGNPWGVRFLTMFHQTNDAELFHTAEQLQKMKFRRDGPRWKKGKTVFLPLYEAKMIQMYDHRAAGVVVDASNWMRQGQPEAATLVEHQNPEFTPEPRWWVKRDDVDRIFGKEERTASIAFKDVTSPTNTRTMIAAFIPHVGVMNSAPLLLTARNLCERQTCCLLANLNSFAMDFVARQKVGGLHLNFFIVEQLPIFAPEFYGDRCPWDRRQTLEKWISDRVLKLTCTSNDMRPLATAAGFDPPVHRWNPEERAELQAELDAAFFLLYGIARDDAAYILSTFSGVSEETAGVLRAESTADLILRHYDQLREKCGSD